MCTEWTTFYAAADKDRPVWSGSEYGFDITTVPKEAWKDLADAAATYLGFVNPVVKRMLSPLHLSLCCLQSHREEKEV